MTKISEALDNAYNTALAGEQAVITSENGPSVVLRRADHPMELMATAATAEEDAELLPKVLGYLDRFHPLVAGKWKEHDHEVQVLVDLIRPAHAPEPEFPPPNGFADARKALQSWKRYAHFVNWPNQKGVPELLAKCINEGETALKSLGAYALPSFDILVSACLLRDATPLAIQEACQAAYDGGRHAQVEAERESWDRLRDENNALRAKIQYLTSGIQDLARHHAKTAEDERDYMERTGPDRKFTLKGSIRIRELVAARLESLLESKLIVIPEEEPKKDGE